MSESGEMRPSEVQKSDRSSSADGGNSSADRAPTDWWRESRQDPAPQWSLGELFLLIAGAAVTSAIARVVLPQLVAAVLSVMVILGWAWLYVGEWEPRWAVIAWRTTLVAYLTSLFVALFKAV